MSKDAVLDIQNALRTIHFTDSRLPPVFPNGYYDVLTQDAVRIYQQTRGLPETGVTDTQTFRILMDEADAIRFTPLLSLPVFSQRHVQLSQGNTDDAVWFVQVMFNILSRVYQNIPSVTVTGEYNSETADAVKALQKIQGREETGTLDDDTWNDLVRLFQTRPLFGRDEL